MVPTLCLDCISASHLGGRCPGCGSPRTVSHPELPDLSIAHIDCDAFYAAIEKRDDPSLADKPVIIGGRSRGVVSTACYIARVRGIKSAMPMFKALKLCPDAIVIKPDMAKYASVGRDVRQLMLETTPLVEPVSIDEAFLDLGGTSRLHGQSPAMTLARLARKIEDSVGITVSVGLAPNKFLAKIASDLMKPRGYSIIGAAEKMSFLAARPVGLIWGVGAAMQKTLSRDGITLVAHLQSLPREILIKRYGNMGDHLYHLSRGLDSRMVSTEHESKSISAETTFNENINLLEDLEPILWRLSERVSKRAKAQGLNGLTVALKLKTADFKLVSRATTLTAPTNQAHQIYSAVHPLLVREIGSTEFRLIGTGISNLSEASEAPSVRSLDSKVIDRDRAESAIDKIRAKFGDTVIGRGLGRAKD